VRRSGLECSHFAVGGADKQLRYLQELQNRAGISETQSLITPVPVGSPSITRPPDFGSVVNEVLDHLRSSFSNEPQSRLTNIQQQSRNLTSPESFEAAVELINASGYGQLQAGATIGNQSSPPVEILQQNETHAQAIDESVESPDAIGDGYSKWDQYR
jgi:hypothetical protein